MKPLVTFADPEAALIDYLLDKWAGRVEAYVPDVDPASEGVTNRAPSDTLAGDETRLQVEVDGVPGADYPLTERATVRVTCWAAPGQPTWAKLLATVTQAFVYAHPGDGDVFSTKPLTGRLKGADPDTGNRFVSFTTRVNMRPRALT